MSEYAASISLLRPAAFVALPGLSFTWRMNSPVPCNVGFFHGAALPDPAHFLPSKFLSALETWPNPRRATATRSTSFRAIKKTTVLAEEWGGFALAFSVQVSWQACLSDKAGIHDVR
jgi:hypothetical protein